MNLLSNEIIEYLNKKQGAAFEIVFNIFYPRLVYFAKEYVPYEDAKNLVQDAFVSFWEKNPAISSESQLQSYLYTIVKNNCLMNLRREKIRKEYNNEESVRIENQINISALEEIDTSAIAFQEIESIIAKTLEELPPRCREIFILSRFEGKSNLEVASELGISSKAVEAQITKALKIFRTTLKDYLPILVYFLGYCK